MAKKIFAALIILFALSSPSESFELVRVGVTEFVNRTNVQDSLNAGLLSYITKTFTEVLSKASDSIEVIRVGEISATTAANAQDTGRNAGCKYILVGALMKYDQYTTFSNAKRTRGTTRLFITLDVRVIDVQTGQVILSASGTGTEESEYKYKKPTSKELNAMKEGKYTGDPEANERYMKMLDNTLYSASSIIADKFCVALHK